MYLERPRHLEFFIFPPYQILDVFTKENPGFVEICCLPGVPFICFEYLLDSLAFLCFTLKKNKLSSAKRRSVRLGAPLQSLVPCGPHVLRHCLRAVDCESLAVRVEASVVVQADSTVGCSDSSFIQLFSKRNMSFRGRRGGGVVVSSTGEWSNSAATRLVRVACGKKFSNSIDATARSNRSTIA